MKTVYINFTALILSVAILLSSAKKKEEGGNLTLKAAPAHLSSKARITDSATIANTEVTGSARSASR